MTETDPTESVLGFEDLTPEWQRLCVVISRLIVEETAKAPPLLSGWLTQTEVAAYRKMSVRGVETERKRGGGPEWSTPNKNGKGMRQHVDTIDRWYRDNLGKETGE